MNSPLYSQTFLKFRAEGKWDSCLFSRDWLRKADALITQPLLISLPLLLLISRSNAETRPLISPRGCYPDPSPPRSITFLKERILMFLSAPCVGHDATAGEVFAFLHYCALPNKGWPHEEDPLQVICALFAHSANFQHFQQAETRTKHKLCRI